MRATILIPLVAACATAAHRQDRPDFTGMWRLVPEASRMVGAGGRVVPGPQNRRITWIIDHRDPRITVTVGVRDSASSHEFAFACTTDGVECLVELPELREVRRMRIAWRGDTLAMEVHARTPYGNFEAADRLFLEPNGQDMTFTRLVTNKRGTRHVRQAFRRLRPALTLRSLMLSQPEAARALARTPMRSGESISQATLYALGRQTVLTLSQ